MCGITQSNLSMWLLNTHTGDSCDTRSLTPLKQGNEVMLVQTMRKDHENLKMDEICLSTTAIVALAHPQQKHAYAKIVPFFLWFKGPI